MLVRVYLQFAINLEIKKIKSYLTIIGALLLDRAGQHVFAAFRWYEPLPKV